MDCDVSPEELEKEKKNTQFRNKYFFNAKQSLLVRVVQQTQDVFPGECSELNARLQNQFVPHLTGSMLHRTKVAY